MVHFGPFWDHFGTLGASWDHGGTQDEKRVRFGPLFDPLLELLLDTFSKQFRSMFSDTLPGIILTDSGAKLVQYGPFSGPLFDPFAKMADITILVDVTMKINAFYSWKVSKMEQDWGAFSRGVLRAHFFRIFAKFGSIPGPFWDRVGAKNATFFRVDFEVKNRGAKS